MLVGVSVFASNCFLCADVVVVLEDEDLVFDAVVFKCVVVASVTDVVVVVVISSSSEEELGLLLKKDVFGEVLVLSGWLLLVLLPVVTLVLLPSARISMKSLMASIGEETRLPMMGSGLRLTKAAAACSRAFI